MGDLYLFWKRSLCPLSARYPSVFRAARLVLVYWAPQLVVGCPRTVDRWSGCSSMVPSIPKESSEYGDDMIEDTKPVDKNAQGMKRDWIMGKVEETGRKLVVLDAH
ncbi:hypothetical protein BDM02DRAFT_3123906 [Thelephora ganbajun]|uniref:Uncharacterized protein n=1 Tax=Thelephora ganbajun TaxID=370292 RepID=A0ACB6Z0K0_THEGA|nr:hypothetical protein BDM02DRAFT_3123906 [Thelephora ganbajun]